MLAIPNETPNKDTAMNDLTPQRALGGWAPLAVTLGSLALVACSALVTELPLDDLADKGQSETEIPEVDTLPDVPSSGCDPACAESIPCLEGRCGEVLQISVGIGLGCALLQSGEVTCWFGDLTHGVALHQVLGVDDAVEVHTEGRQGCALRRDGSVACWGDLQSGYFGYKPEIDFVAKPIPNVSGATGLAVGQEHACALLADGQVGCWGRNRYGQLGRSTSLNMVYPFGRVEDLSDVRLIAAGTHHTCAILADQSVHCWGWNIEGQLGHAGAGHRAMPVGVRGAVALSLGTFHSCVLDREQRVWCWGPRFAWGQPLDPDHPRSREMMEVVALRGAVAIAAGNHHTCALGADGAVRCVGINSDGACKHDDPARFISDAAAPAIAGARAVAAGFLRSCALLADGSVRCWGDIGPEDDGSKPIKVEGLPKVAALRVGGIHSCARGETGPWQCWGLNQHGQIGIEAEWTDVPQALPLADVADLVLGTRLSCARKDDGSVWCWGLQNIDFYDNQWAMFTPTRIDGMPPSDALFVGDVHACSLSDGEAWCWGGNNVGQAIPGAEVVLTQPTLVSPDLRFRDLSLSIYLSCGITVDGALYCWGDDHEGRLGRLPNGELGVAPVLGLEQGRSVVVGYEHACVLAADARVYCVGGNRQGVLGTGDFVASAELRQSQVLGARTLASVDEAMFALQDDGRVLSWGSGYSGMLGDGVGGVRAKPVQVAGLEDVVAMGTGIHHACALTRTGEVWCWGTNAFGLLGQPPQQRQVEVGGLAVRACGDGLLHAGEACDDGNLEGGDGCDSTCHVEPGWRCDRRQGCLQLRPGDICDQAIALSLPSAHQGSFEGFANDYNPTYTACTGRHQATGADVVFKLDLAPGASARVSAQSDLDLVLYVSTACPEIIGSCVLGADAAGAGGLEQLTLHNDTPEPQTYYIVVDSYVWAPEAHAFWLEVAE